MDLKLIEGGVLEGLGMISSDSVDSVITSPPYWGLRDYGVDGQLGLESSLDEYLSNLLEVTAELKRVLKSSGVLFWNHGDCYGGSGQGSATGYADARRKRVNGSMDHSVVLSQRSKCMVLQNYRFIQDMIDSQGWILRNVIIWHKLNCMPSSVRDRFTNSYEPVFMLVKKKKYFFDLDAVRIPHKGTGGGDGFGANALLQSRNKDTREHPAGKNPGDIWGYPDYSFNYRVREAEAGHRGVGERASEIELEAYRKGISVPGQRPQGIHRKRHSGYFGADGESLVSPAGKNPGDLWSLPTQPFPDAHFATFPEKLITPLVLAGCPEWICKECGKPRVRITEREVSFASGSGKSGNVPVGKYSRSVQALSGDYDVRMGPVANHITVGWSDCGCGVGFRPGVILDPFVGSGTTMKVAREFRRSCTGIDINPEYLRIARRRIGWDSTVGDIRFTYLKCSQDGGVDVA